MIGIDFLFWDLVLNFDSYCIVVILKFFEEILYVIVCYGIVENGSIVVYFFDFWIQYCSIFIVIV